MNDFIKTQQELAKTSAPIYQELGDKKHFIFEKADIETIISKTITNTVAEIMRRVEGEETETYQETDGGWCGEETVCLDTIKQHITNLTTQHETNQDT